MKIYTVISTNDFDGICGVSTFDSIENAIIQANLIAAKFMETVSILSQTVNPPLVYSLFGQSKEDDGDSICVDIYETEVGKFENLD